MQDSGSCSALRWANLLRLWGPWAFAALAFLAFQCQKQRTSRWTNELGVWVPAFLPTSITKPWSELAQHPLCFTSNKWTAWAAFSSVFVRGQAVGTARSAETGAGVHGERVTWVSVLRCPGGDGIVPIRAKSQCCFSAQTAEEGCVPSLCLHRCAAFL